MRELLDSPGWRVFLAHVDEVYGPRGYRARVQQALAKPNPHEEVSKLEMATHIAEHFAAWPSKRLKELEPVPTGDPLRRGGY